MNVLLITDSQTSRAIKRAYDLQNRIISTLQTKTSGLPPIPLCGLSTQFEDHLERMPQSSHWKDNRTVSKRACQSWQPTTSLCRPGWKRRSIAHREKRSDYKPRLKKHLKQFPALMLLSSGTESSHRKNLSPESSLYDILYHYHLDDALVNPRHEKSATISLHQPKYWNLFIRSAYSVSDRVIIYSMWKWGFKSTFVDQFWTKDVDCQCTKN